MSERVKNVGSEIDPPHLEQPTLAFLKTYWESKRRGRPMPSRADIDPTEMKEHLGWIVLVDVLPGFADFRYRVVGTLVTGYFLRDSTGKTLIETCLPLGEPVMKGFLAAYRKAARDRVPLRVFGDAGWLGKEFLDFEGLLLPLSDDGVAANMVLAAFTFDHDRQRLNRLKGSF